MPSDVQNGQTHLNRFKYNITIRADRSLKRCISKTKQNKQTKSSGPRLCFAGQCTASVKTLACKDSHKAASGPQNSCHALFAPGDRTLDKAIISLHGSFYRPLMKWNAPFLFQEQSKGQTSALIVRNADAQALPKPTESESALQRDLEVPLGSSCL